MIGLVLGLMALAAPTDGALLLRIEAMVGERMVFEQYTAKADDWEYTGYERIELTAKTEDRLTWKLTSSAKPGTSWSSVSDTKGQVVMSKERPAQQTMTKSGSSLVPSQMQFPETPVDIGDEWTVTYADGQKVYYRLEGVETVNETDCAKILSWATINLGTAKAQVESTCMIEVATGWLYQRRTSQKFQLGEVVTWTRRATPVKMRLSGKKGDTIKLVAEHAGRTPTKGEQFWSTIELVKVSQGQFTWKTNRLNDEDGAFWTTVTDSRGVVSSLSNNGTTDKKVEGATNTPALIVFPEQGLLPGDSWVHTHGYDDYILDYDYTFLGPEKARGIDCWKIEGRAKWEDVHGMNSVVVVMWYERSTGWIVMSANRIDYKHRGLATMTIVRG
ncbi:MAG: hypothetical protein IH944_12550 [Armatimonadetes bacterium]|nr:hypothetical protein [Armatimonadota bacterium]